jgi:hypothetical protein
MHRIARVSLACSTLLLLAACAKSDQAVKDSAAGAMATPAAAPEAAPAPPATIALADVAGKWKVTTVPESGPDTATTTAVLIATPDTSGWSLQLKSGQKVPIQVTAAGDSVMTKSAIYPSMRRKGKQVWSEGFLRLQDGKLTGVTVAHYITSGADSVLRLRTEGTKVP